MTQKSQNAAILQHLQDGLHLTPLRALELFGCLRLSARIYDLRAQGHRIESDIFRVWLNCEWKRVSIYWMRVRP